MPLKPVPVVVVRTQKTHLGGGDYDEVEAPIAGSPFLGRWYRTAQKSFLPDEPAPGTATVDEQQRLSIMDPACPIAVNDIAYLPQADGSYLRAKVLRIRPYADRRQYDLETGAEGSGPPATLDVADEASGDAVDVAQAAPALGPALDVAEASSSDAQG